MTDTLLRLDRVLGAALRIVPMLCLAALFVILFGNVLSRYFQIWSIAWFDEIVQALFAWMVFIGAAALWREHDHFRIDWLETFLDDETGGGPASTVLRALLALLSLGFLAVLAWKGLDLTLRSRAVTPILNIPVATVYAAIPFSAAIMCAYSLRDLVVLYRATRRRPAKDDP